MGWDRHKLLWDGNGTDKYVPWTTLVMRFLNAAKLEDNLMYCGREFQMTGAL